MNAKQDQINEALEKFKKQYEVEKVGDNKYKFNITINADAFQKSYDAMLKKQSSDLKVKGFRDGKVPPKSVEKQVQKEVLNKTFQTLSQSYILSAIYAEELAPITPAKLEKMPNILLGTDIKFSFTIVTEPEFDLPDFSEITVEEPEQDVTVEDEEIEKALQNLHLNVIQLQNQENDNKKKTDEKDEEKIKFSEEMPEEFTDEWATKVAKKLKIPGIKKVDDLKDMIRREVKSQKSKSAKMDYQGQIMEKIKEKVDLEIPVEAIEMEVEQREKSFQHRLKETDTSLEDWLEKQDLTEEKLKEMWTEDAKEALLESAILNKYADQKELQVEQEEIKQIEESYRKQYKDFQPTDQWRNQIVAVLLKQKAFNKILEEVETK